MNRAVSADSLANVEIFSAFRSDELEELAENAQVRQYDLGDTILAAGDPASGIYLVTNGKVRVFTPNGGKEKSSGVCVSGETFGENSILRNPKIDYSVRSSGKAEILFFPKENIRNALTKNDAARQFMIRYVAMKVSRGFIGEIFGILTKTDPQELQQIVQSIGIRKIAPQERILVQDSAENRDLYLVRSGEVALIREENGNFYNVTSLSSGDIFGEKACLTYSEQQVTVMAKRDTILLIIPQKTFHMILERNPAIRPVLEKRILNLEKEIQRQKKLSLLKSGSLLFDTKSEPGLGERIIRGFPMIEQAEERDCGAACLAMICRHYDIGISPGKLREMANITPEGATMESLAYVGESLGFECRGLKCTYPSMLGFDLPFIVHWKGYHYIVVYGISKTQVWLADPASGFRKMSVSEFEQGWDGYCLIFTPTKNLVQTGEPHSPWLRFFGYLRPLKKILLDLLLAALVIQVLGIAPPIIIQNILDRVVVHQNFEMLNVMIIGLGITLIFSHLTGFLSGYLMNFLILKLDFSMISHFYRYVLSLPIQFFHSRKIGDIIARFHENNTVRRFMTEGSISTILNALMIFTYVIVMLIYNVKLTLMLLAFLPPIILLTLLAAPKYRDYARRIFFAGAEAQSMLVETLGGPEIVKGMGIGRAMRLKWEKKYAKTLDVRYHAEIFTILIGTLTGLLRAGTHLTLLWVGTRMVLNQELTIGQLMAFNVLIGNVMTPVIGLAKVWDELQETLVAMERLGDVLELEPEQKPETVGNRIVLPDIRGDIRFDNVYFRFGGTDSPHILKNISFEAKAGSMIAIVGQSGSGKSTLARLLLGFYTPTEGRVYVDDYDLNTIELDSYRSQIGYVMQDNILFSGTVAENIALGDENPDHKRIVASAKSADADSFIRNLSMGYEQIVGERGTGLSEGQIQRICIARALYNNPRILIFDEATSSLDSESENRIQQHMRQVMQDRTAIIISHRLSTIMNADKILVLYQGSIAEMGDHRELYSKKGMYYHLIQNQVSGYLSPSEMLSIGGTE